MSFLAKLKLDNETFTVLEFNIHFTQHTDNNGRPASKTKGGSIKLVVESTQTGLFSDWMVSKTSVKDGEIIFYRRDAMSTMKNVTFKKAYCISFRKRFQSEGVSPMTTEILLTSNEVKIGSTVFESSWKTDNL